MKILAIETSCDDTGIALIEAGEKNQIKILANLVSSQIAIHAPFGGVVPNLAKREHLKNLPILWEKLTKTYLPCRPACRTGGQAGNLKPKILNLIAVTQGPGLAPCLWTGINFAKELAKKYKKPLVGINHLKGHIFSAFLQKSREENPKKNLQPVKFPILSLIVSGGHTELVFSKKLGHYQIIGETLDDAAGECFDKVARLLGLRYPGGPEIAREVEKLKTFVVASKAKQSDGSEIISLPRPMINSKDFNFSFSGLKTAVLYLLRDLEKQKIDIKKLRPAIAKEFQDAVVEVLVKKTILAAKEYKPKTIILGGGVAANKKLREELGKEIKKNLQAISYKLPAISLTSDNALMIALAAWAERKILKPIRNLEEMEAKANWRIGDKYAILGKWTT